MSDPLATLDITKDEAADILAGLWGEDVRLVDLSSNNDIRCGAHLPVSVTPAVQAYGKTWGDVVVVARVRSKERSNAR